MSSGLLSQREGLWYLGEQCGVDQYLDIPSGDSFDVCFYDLYKSGLVPEKYGVGHFHGWKIEEAEKYLVEITQ